MKKSIILLLVICLMVWIIPKESFMALEDEESITETDTAEDNEDSDIDLIEDTDDSEEVLDEQESNLEEWSESSSEESDFSFSEEENESEIEENDNQEDEYSDEESVSEIEEENSEEELDKMLDEEDIDEIDEDTAEPDEETAALLASLFPKTRFRMLLKAATSSSPTYESEISNFPSSYQTILQQLHSSHPNWIFVAVDTGLDWNTAAAMESSGNRSLVPAASSSLLKSNAEGDYVAQTGTYIHKDNTQWDCANLPAVVHFMDPRNFLNDQYIWMFEGMEYDSSQTVASVEAILSGTFMNKVSMPQIVYKNAEGKKVTVDTTYAQLIWESGKAQNLSPLYIASKIRQEVGGSGTSGSITGSYTTDNGDADWAKYNGNSLDGYYNFYNIAANDSAHPITLGLGWAAGRPNTKGTMTETSYNRPWTSPILSIHNGAQYIMERYVANGQTTPYFTRFNVTKTAQSNGTLYGYQYMTNVSGAASEASTTYTSYKNMGTLDLKRTFYIPVFRNMPDLSELPYFSGTTGKGVTTSALNMRNAPSMGGSWMVTVPSGTTVEIIEGALDTTNKASIYTMELNPYWYKIKATVSGKSYTGYVSADFVKMTTAKTVTEGSTLSLTLKSTPSQKVFYQSGNPWIATVDQNGKVTGVNAGTTDIYVYTATGISAIGVEVKAKTTSSSSSGSTGGSSSGGSSSDSGSSSSGTSSGTTSGSTTTAVFSDVADSSKYYYKPVYWAAENVITKGYSDGTFRPQAACTREAVVTFLWRYAGKPEPKSSVSPFSDVQNKSKYYYKAVLWAAEQGITKGYSDGTFKPDATCLREHVVMFLWRFAGKPAGDSSTFPDVKSSAYYYKAVQWAVKTRITHGYSDGTFKPEADCWREHVITFLYRYDNL